MNIGEITERLNGVRKISGGFVARCPAHEDRLPSLSVSEGTDGRILLHCHAGCSHDAIVKALGIGTRDLFADAGSKQEPKKPPPPPLSEASVNAMAAALAKDPAAWKHVTETLKFDPEVVRSEKLGLHVDHFGHRWLAYPYRLHNSWTVANCRSLDGDKDFVRHPSGQPTTLYRGDTLVDNGITLLVEGEKDTIAVLTMGLASEIGGSAGCSIVGMPGVGHVKIAVEALRSQRLVYVATDSDAKGDEAANKVIAGLGKAKCRRVRLEGVKDFGDLLAAHGDGATVLALAAIRTADGPRQQGNSHARLVDMAYGDYEPAPLIRTGINALDNALHGGIPLNKLSVIAARTSHGKTATAVRLAVNMVLGGRPVIVLWTEDEEVEFDLRALSVLSGTPLLSVLDAYRAKQLAGIWARVPEAKKQAWRQHCRTVHMERPTPEEIADLIRCESGATILFDHLGESNWGTGTKHELIGDGLRLIRSAALERKCLFIAMAQLNRDWDRRKAASENPEKVRPCLSDIENSGQIEQVARVCIIAEKIMAKQDDGEIPSGEYRYHIFKPTIAVASCRWHEQSATPDNPEPVRLAAIQSELPHWSDR